MGKINIIIIGALMFSLASCGLFKKSTKHSESQKYEATIKEETKKTDSLNHQKQSGEEKTDKGVVVTEKKTTETTVTKGASEVKVRGKLKGNGETVLEDSIGNKVILMLDSLTRKIEIKVNRTHDVQTTKETLEKTTEHKDQTSKKNDSETKVQTQQVATTRDEETHVELKKQEKTSTPKVFALVASILAAILGIGALLYFFIIRKR